MMPQLGKIVILAGAVLILIGIALTFFDRIPLVGRLPGDIHIKRDNFQLYFPLTTSIVVSIILTLLLWLGRRIGGG